MIELADFKEEEVLIFGAVGLPAERAAYNFRNKITEKGIEDLMQTNCSNLTSEEFHSFLSDDNLIWPPFKNWTKDWIILFSKLRGLKKEVDKNQDLESN